MISTLPLEASDTSLAIVIDEVLLESTKIAPATIPPGVFKTAEDTDFEVIDKSAVLVILAPESIVIELVEVDSKCSNGIDMFKIPLCCNNPAISVS